MKHHRPATLASYRPMADAPFPWGQRFYPYVLIVIVIIMEAHRHREPVVPTVEPARPYCVSLPLGPHPPRPVIAGRGCRAPK